VKFTRTFFFLVICLASACGEDDEIIYTSENLFTPVEIQTVRGMRPVMKVIYNDRIVLDMLVDTGSSITVLPAALFGYVEGMYEIDKLCFSNGICFRNRVILSANSGFAQLKPGYYNGIVGIDLLRNFDLTIDYKNKHIYFIDLGNLSQPEANFLFFYEEISALRPRTTISLEGRDYSSILLDTGSAFTRLTPNMFDALENKPEITYQGIAHHFKNKENVTHHMFGQYCVGISCPREIPIEVARWQAIGGTFFREYLIVFNFNQKILKLTPYNNREHIFQDPVWRVGMQLDIFDAEKIVYVQRESPAWNAGIREGDDLIAINDVSILVLGYFGVYKLLEDPLITEFHISIRFSNGQTETVLVRTDT